MLKGVDAARCFSDFIGKYSEFQVHRRDPENEFHGPFKLFGCLGDACCCARERVGGVIGFDIAGAEKGNPPRLFKEAYTIARKAGLGLTAHAGEDENAQAVWEAIDELGCQRIGHGCAAIQDKTLLRRLARDQILIEVCQTSNYQTGAVKEDTKHPLYTFLEYGIPVAICTDNTTVSNTNQTKENELLNLNVEEIQNIHFRAAAHTFIK